MILHGGFEVKKALSDDIFSLVHSKEESLPGLVEACQIVLVFISQLEVAGNDVRVVIVHNELKLLLDWFDLALELALAIVDFCQLILVPLELLLAGANLSEFIDSISELCKELLEFFFTFLN